MNVDFFPRIQLVQRLHEGWRLIDGQDYRSNEWAILMHLPAAPERATEQIVRDAFRRFRATLKGSVSNKSAAAVHRNSMRWTTARAGKLAKLVAAE